MFDLGHCSTYLFVRCSMFGRCFVRSVLCSIMDARCCVVCSVRDYFFLFDVLFESSVLFNVLFDMLCFVRCFVRHNFVVFCSMFGERSNSEQFVRVHVR